MGSPRTQSPCSPGEHHSHGPQDAMRNDMQLSPQDLLSPDSLRPELPSRQLLFAYQHVLFADRKSTIPPSLVGKIVHKPVTKSNGQPKSIMALKLDRLKDKLRGMPLFLSPWMLKARVSPPVFPFAGHIFLVLMVIVVGSVIVGWYGLSKDTISHSKVTTISTTTATPVPATYAFVWPTQTESQDQFYLRGRRDTMPSPIMTTTSSEDFDKITVVQTIIVTITRFITDTAQKTLTTTVFLSMCTTCVTTSTISASVNIMNSSASSTEGVMTGIMYCSFTGRHNIYTLCPLVHANSPGMLTDTPAMVSTTSRTKNPFSAVRVAVVSLWNSFAGLASVIQPKGDGGCDCGGFKKKLDSAVNLVRMQQRLLDSQRAIINGHRKSLFLALETLANLTAARAGEKASGERQLNLKI
ncbi:hypothetical protein F4803DRAFT_550727 [Xylaria telfairii]|nr:hypothetical protein F4803DRAFT_550727 [Xylaria telfairii]